MIYTIVTAHLESGALAVSPETQPTFQTAGAGGMATPLHASVTSTSDPPVLEVPRY